LQPERRRTWQAESVPDTVLETIEAFYDAVPRPLSDAHERGPLTLFVARAGWPYYARPTPGAVRVEESDVRALLELAEELDVPRTLEWVHETTPSLTTAARAAGLRVYEMPLLVLEGRVADVPAAAVQVDMLGPDDPRIADARAAVEAGFTDTDEKELEPVAPWIAELIRRSRSRRRKPPDPGPGLRAGRHRHPAVVAGQGGRRGPHPPADRGRDLSRRQHRVPLRR
jgi:hypothetical protein